MKKVLPILIIAFIVVVIVLIFISMSTKDEEVVYYENNHKHEPIDIKLQEFKDIQCGMSVTSLVDSAQAIHKNGRTWLFDDVGCLALWYKEYKNKKELKLFVYSRDTYKYIDARKAWYITTASTAMRYGFAANKTKKDEMISFDEMLLRMYRGEDLTNPYIRKKLLKE